MNFFFFIKYFVVGLFCLLIDFGIFYLFSYKFNFHWFISSTLSLIISSLIGFLLFRKIVYRTVVDNIKSKYIILYYFSNNIFSLILNQFVLFLLIEKFAFSLFYSKIISTFIIILYNLYIRTKYIFK